MQIPSRCSVAEDLSWGIASLLSTVLCAALLPFLAVIWLYSKAVR